jgi:ubiquinone biosynthesis protein
VRHLVGDDQSDMRQLERDCSPLLGEVEAGGISPAAMRGVMDVMERHDLRPPRSMMLLSRTMLTLEGTLKTIHPDFDLAAEAERLVSRETRGYVGTPEELLRTELVHMLPALRTLPEHVEAIANQWRSGRLVLRTERYGGRDRAVVEGWLNRALVAAAGAAGVVASGVILAAGSLSPDKGVRDALWTLGFSGLTGASVLLLRTVAQALHGQPVRSEQ